MEIALVPELVSLRDAWELRNAASATLARSERQMRRLLESAGPEQVITLLEAFSPARSPGPEWTRSFDPLLERLWLWCNAETLAAVEAEFRRRGPAWVAFANSLTPEYGAEVRGRVRQFGSSRLPALTLE